MTTIGHALRHSLRGVLHPRLFHFARMCWWYSSTYFPNSVLSLFVKRQPSVEAFGAGGDELARLISRVNTVSPTPLCAVMTKYGSDKGQKRHNYTTVYWALLSGLWERPLRIVEIGLGTNHPEFASSMGVYGRPGASLRGWCESFPNAAVVGADIDRTVLFQGEWIRTYYCDQLDQDSVREFWSQPGLQDGADLIVEDGLHTFEANISFLEASLDRLRPGGVYVVEDIAVDSVSTWRAQLERVYVPAWPECAFTLVMLPNRMNQEDNNLLVVRRRAQNPSTMPATAMPAHLSATRR